MSLFFTSSLIRRVIEKRGSRFFRSIGDSNSIVHKNKNNNSCCPLLMVLERFGESKVHNVSSKGKRELRMELEVGDDLEVAGSSHGWLALSNDDDVVLWNPMSSEQQRIKLPPLHTLGDPSVNAGGGVSRVALSSDGDDWRAVITVGRARRLAFCAPGMGVWTQIGEHYCQRRHYYRERRETAPREYEDVVYSSRHKLFFCITRVGSELEAWNLHVPGAPTIDWRLGEQLLMFNRPTYDWPASKDLGKEQLLACWHLKYLVLVEEKEEEELFLVVRHVCPRGGSLSEEDRPGYYSKYRGCDYSRPYKTIGFDVYRIDRQLQKVEEGSLDGAALFVGMSHSYSYAATSALELGLEADSIYFADEKRLMRLSQSDDYGGHDNGIFNYRTNTFSSFPCTLNSNSNSRIDPPPLWFTPTSS